MSRYITHPKLCLMVQDCITHEGVGTLTVVEVIINTKMYSDILEDNLQPVITRLISAGDLFSRMSMIPYIGLVLAEYKARDNIHSLLWPSQSPYLNIIENLQHRLKISLNTPREASLQTALCGRHYRYMEFNQTFLYTEFIFFHSKAAWECSYVKKSYHQILRNEI